MFPPYFYFRFSRNGPLSLVFQQLCTALAPHLAVIQFCVTANLGDGQWTATTRAGSLRNTLWHDNLGRSRIELATVAPQIYQTQNFASALRASTFGPAGLSMNTGPHRLGPSPFRSASALRASAPLRSIAFSSNALHAAPIFRDRL